MTGTTIAARRRRSVRRAAAAILALCAGLSLHAQDAPPFPEPRPASRSQAEITLAGGSLAALDSLSARIAHVVSDGTAPAAAVRAAATLRAPIAVPGLRSVEPLPGIRVSFTTDETTFDAVPARDDDADGLPDALASVVSALASAEPVLRDELALAPPPVDVFFGRTAAGIEGYATVAGDGARARIVLDIDPAGGEDARVRAAIREFAFATALTREPGLDPSWADAFARWTVVRLSGPDAGALDAFAERRDRFREGLASDDARLAAGNALWFAWLDEGHGARAVRVLLEELGRGDTVAAAIDRATRRSFGGTRADALREFQLWALLTGERSDGQHFSFAGRLSDPAFAREADWLPAISVQSDDPIAPLGGSTFRLAPDGSRGGMAVRFEGGFDAEWGADILLRLDDGSRVRVPIALEAGRGEVIVPLAGLEEAVLLVRNETGDGRPPARFTWAAHAERGFPFDLARLDGRRIEGDVPGVLVSWETSTESHLLGFHVLRTPAEGGPTRRVSPIWIPAIGDVAVGATYQFVDASAEPGRAYVYRIEGITVEGLRAATDPTDVVAGTR